MNKNHIFYFVILTILLFVSSCASKPEDLIVGKWQMTELSTNSPEANNPDVQEFYAEMAKNSYSIYNSDLHAKTL